MTDRRQEAKEQLAAELGSLRAAVRDASAVKVGQLGTPAASEAIMAALWPPGTMPHDWGHADWWRTPLGRECAAGLLERLADKDIAVTQAVAADILGVQRNGINTYLVKGYLQRSVPRVVRGQRVESGVSLASVLARVARAQ